MNLYRDLIIDLYKNPLNKRQIHDADLTSSGANVTCGDRVRIYAKFKKTKRGEIISDISFEGELCAISNASASLLTKEAKGKTAEKILKWNTKNIFRWLGEELGPSRVKCGFLALETLQKAIKKHKRRADTV